ncbi:MAG: hydroxyacid dehydrogenase [Promethearchaeota archaeon]
MKKYKCLIADSCSNEGLKAFAKYPNIEVVLNTKHTTEELIRLIPEYHAMIVRSATKVTREVVQAAKNLKVIARAGAGYNNIDVDACNEKGIAVVITPTGNTNAVVELTMGLMLSFARNIPLANASMKDGRWDKKKLAGTEIKGKTLGTLGIGRIGAGVAERCKVFGMRIIAYDKYVTQERLNELGLEYVELYEDLDKFLADVDYLSLHIPATPETTRMLNKEKFEIMKKSAVLINCARGEVVNEQDLYNALVNGDIAGACIDVYSAEPAKKDAIPFIALDNVVCTPHLGASTNEAQVNVAQMAADQIGLLLNEGKYIDCVNKKALNK